MLTKHKKLNRISITSHLGAGVNRAYGGCMTHTELQAALTAKTPHWTADTLCKLTGLSERTIGRMLMGKSPVHPMVMMHCVNAGRF